ncbi:fatty acid hydroxylase [Cellulophaga lytica]|uniref:sterol desaturase family protein n=1 Tax=Cellulophaga lytica TaxID=979 RepID=UPI0009503EB2|nr:sterol desaturase family protein [Cellulophaga lytica]APU10186.1 fatty acid hydroxylase [Cellulophaga lytica]
MNLKDFTIFFALLIGLNIAGYLLNIGISLVWNKVYKHRSKITKKEVLSSILTLFINIIIAIPGYILWVKGFITFNNQDPWLTFIILFLFLDILMYVLHWASHNIVVLKKIHLQHHEHTEQFNVVSLYYMSPWESILFGLLLTVVALLFSLNVYGFIAFLIFNWFYGVVTHLNTKLSKPYFLIFTTNYFHKNHHKLFSKNYGFYTILWDRLFKTESTNL